MRLMSFFEQRGVEMEVFDSIYPRIEKEEDNGDTFLETFIEVLLARQRFQTIVGNKVFFYLTVLRTFLENPAFKQRFLSLKHTPFIP